jgi:hypothetical protein
MNKQFAKNNLMWGFLLWLFGYLASFVLFFLVPPSFIGWILMPLGIFITLWVLMKQVKANGLNEYLIMGVIWLLIALVFDYFFIVEALNPADGYYKPSVYIYYALTFLLPIAVSIFKKNKVK